MTVVVRRSFPRRCLPNDLSGIAIDRDDFEAVFLIGANAFRMPLFLPKEMEMEWLRPDLTDEEMQKILDYEMPSDQIVPVPVYSIRGRTPRPDGKPKNAPFAYQDLPALGNDQGMLQQGLF